MFESSRGRNRSQRCCHLSPGDLDLELDKLAHELVHVALVDLPSSTILVLATDVAVHQDGHCTPHSGPSSA
eukprot:2831580-Heterocapsa_arctica.AAC.1